jgi:hypothetical protein
LEPGSTAGKLRRFTEHRYQYREARSSGQQGYLEAVEAMQARATGMPHALLELTARIERLRERLHKGDPDMTADEIQAAIDWAEGKRRELQGQQPAARQSAKVAT